MLAVIKWFHALLLPLGLAVIALTGHRLGLIVYDLTWWIDGLTPGYAAAVTHSVLISAYVLAVPLFPDQPAPIRRLIAHAVCLIGAAGRHGKRRERRQRRRQR